MKKPYYLALLLTTLTMTATTGTRAAFGDDDPPVVGPLPTIPVLLPVLPDRVFAPRGFDDNDNSQITVTGNYPSTCFRAALPVVEVDHERRQVHIQNRVFYYSTALCQRMLVPYVQTIDLGILRAVNYRISFQRADGAWVPQSRITVAHSKNAGPDDFLYPLVTDARTEPVEGTSRKTLILDGMLPNGCMAMPEIKLVYRPDDVIEVLPITSMKTVGPCIQMLIPYQVRTELDPTWRGPTLIHVRSLNGQSLNKVVEF
jgi:hypothetical protein